MPSRDMIFTDALPLEPALQFAIMLAEDALIEGRIFTGNKKGSQTL